MKMILTGTGTSHGVPVIGCECAVCTSSDPRDCRYRCSAYVTNRDDIKKDGLNPSAEPVDVVVDTGPEFRLQAIKYKINRLDAVFITHSHADHLHGLDDVRRYSCCKLPDQAVEKKLSEKERAILESAPMPLYANSGTLKDIRVKFDYVFMAAKEGGGKPKIDLIDAGGFSASSPINVKSLQVIPVPLMHGHMNDCGWLFSVVKSDGKKHSIAYLTDCSFISDESLELIKNNAGVLEHVVIDGLREEHHSTHFNFLEALGAADRLNAPHTWLIHLTHDKSHVQVQKYVDEHLGQFTRLSEQVKNGGSAGPGYDGLELEF